MTLEPQMMMEPQMTQMTQMAQMSEIGRMGPMTEARRKERTTQTGRSRPTSGRSAGTCDNLSASYDRSNPAQV
jgi:hypothetical protein